MSDAVASAVARKLYGDADPGIRLELHVNTDGAAFGGEDEDELRCQHELGRILTEIAHEIALHGYELEGVRRILDGNGNRCGYWVMTMEPLPR